jgi:hypothetical protein
MKVVGCSEILEQMKLTAWWSNQKMTHHLRNNNHENLTTRIKNEAYLTLLCCDTDRTGAAVGGWLPAVRYWADAAGTEPDVGGVGVTVT